MAAKAKPAGIFLAVVATVIVVVIGGFLWMQSDPVRALRLAFEPSEPFSAISTDPIDYSDDANWAALPTKDTFAKARPEGVMDIAVIPEVDLFYLHPTTYLKRDNWNSPLDDTDANNRIENRVLKMQASAYNLAANVYAPRYRQATFGAFFDEDGDGLQALLFAYADVVNAFDNFINERNNGRPFIIAGHSQGSLHLLGLLAQRVAGTDLADRMVAAYVVGWPVSMEADIDALVGIEACADADQTGCIVSYQTFGPKGETAGIEGYFQTTVGLGGTPRVGTKMLCTNPLTWTVDGSAEASSHKGAAERVEDAAPLGTPLPEFSGAACNAKGFLMLDREPGEAWQDFKMAGENYHVYDYHLFYMNIRENAARRAVNWLAAHR